MGEELAHDQEKRLQTQQKRRNAEIKRAVATSSQDELRGKLLGQAEKAEKAAQEATASEAVQAAAFEAVQAELADLRGKSAVLEKLAASLHGRQRALVEERQDVLAHEERERQQLSDRFKSTIGEVQVRLEELGAQRAAQVADSDRLSDELRALTGKHTSGEAEQAALLRAFDAQHASLQVELEAEAAWLGEAEQAEAELPAEAERSAAREAEHRASLAEYGNKMQAFQEELEASNAQFSQHKAALSAATQRLADADAAHAALKARRAEEARQAKQSKAEAEAAEAEAARLRAQVGRLRAVCASLRGATVEAGAVDESAKQ